MFVFHRFHIRYVNFKVLSSVNFYDLA